MPRLLQRRSARPDAAAPGAPAPRPDARFQVIEAGPAAAKVERNPAIQGARGLAALMIFTTHFRITLGGWLGNENYSTPVRAADALARLGTELLFALSGFLLYGMLIRGSLRYGRFLLGRVRRLYPAFLCVLAVYLLLAAVVRGWHGLPADPAAAARLLVLNLTLMAGLVGERSLICITWTLSYELALYVTLPLLVRFSGMRHWPAPRRVGFLILLGAGYGWLACGPGWVFVRPGVYLAGFLAYEAVAARRGTPSGRGELLAVLAILASLAAVAALRVEPWCVANLDPAGTAVGGLRAVASGVGLFALAWCCFGEGGRLARLLAWAPLKRVGDVSYSFFLIHVVVLEAARVLAPGLVPPGESNLGLFLAAFSVCLGVSLAAAAVIHAWVEVPFGGRKSERPAVVGPILVTDTISDFDPNQRTSTTLPQVSEPAHEFRPVPASSGSGSAPA